MPDGALFFPGGDAGGREPEEHAEVDGVDEGARPEDHVKSGEPLENKGKTVRDKNKLVTDGP